MNEHKTTDFAVIGGALNELLIATGNKLSSEWPAKYQNVTGARELFVIHLRIAWLTYRSALYLGGDIPSDSRRLPEFCVSLPVLNRALLDSLFTVLFILEDLPGRCELFYEADWKEMRLDLNRYLAEYSGLPEWKSHLEDRAKLCEMGLAHAKLNAVKAADPGSLRSWPNPGAMVSFGVSQNCPLSPVQAFMKYLNDYFYIDLSQQAHLGGWGIAKRGAFLLDEIRHKPGIDAQIKKYRYAQIGQSVALVLALVSEIDVHFNFGARAEALSVWNSAAQMIVVVKEMYDKRYASLLG